MPIEEILASSGVGPQNSKDNFQVMVEMAEYLFVCSSDVDILRAGRGVQLSPLLFDNVCK